MLIAELRAIGCGVMLIGDGDVAGVIATTNPDTTIDVYMLDLFPVTEVILKVFKAGGECAKIDWSFLGLSMPVWVLVLAVLLTAFGLWINLRKSA